MEVVKEGMVLGDIPNEELITNMKETGRPFKAKEMLAVIGGQRQ